MFSNSVLIVLDTPYSSPTLRLGGKLSHELFVVFIVLPFFIFLNNKLVVGVVNFYFVELM